MSRLRPPSSSDPSGRAPGRYVPALDGVRALAIAAVVAYHGGLSWMSGGFLGVDIFFVLSGFLITTLLLAEVASTGGLRLGRFWSRRARRLLPALLAVLLAVAAYAAVLAPPDAYGRLRGDALATLAYVANWHAIFSGQGYFAQLAAPSPLLHTWSLAIEEQFYLLWPLMALGVAAITTRRRRLRGPAGPIWPAVLTVSLIGAAASAVAMAVLYHGGAGVTRVYYGTDTRAQDLLVGAALAALLARPVERGEEPGGPPRPAGDLVLTRIDHPVARAALVAAATVDVAALGWMCTKTDGSSAWLYRGGFTAAALATAGLLMCVVLVPHGPWARLLSLGPVRYLGRISYGLYLWHWPVFLTLDHARTGLSGAPLLVVRVVAAVAVSSASYHLLEMPIRRGALGRWRAWALTPAAAGGVAAVLVASTAGAAAAPAAGAAPVPTSSQPASPPAADAGSGGAIRSLLVGDSLATSLALGLVEGQERYHTATFSGAVVGCGLVTTGLVTNRGETGPEKKGIDGNGHWVDCASWPQRWRQEAERFHPDVSLVVEGPWEVRDHLIGGHWIHLGQPAFDRLERVALEEAVDSLSAGGGRVVLVTSPYFQQPEQEDGRPWPADDRARVDRYNQLLRQVAAAHPGEVTVIDLGAAFSPGGRYRAVVDGVRVRADDGLHFTDAGARVVQRWLLPRIAALGAEERSSRGQPPPP